ncbi:ras-related GTP-binding protein B-like [Aphis gossypii]|nr:ras-related GTP-binding protein B-like [Aphis gossypii]
MSNVHKLENTLKLFAEEMECDEVILFERATLLVVAKYVRVPPSDEKRPQRVSKTIKNFKAKLDRNKISHDLFEIKLSRLTIFIHKFIFDTFLMVVTRDTLTELISFNIKSLKAHFSKLLQDSCQQPKTSG